MTRLASAAVLTLVLAAGCGGSSIQHRAGSASLEGDVLGPTATQLRVDLPGTMRSTTTDSAGHFSFLGVPAGAASLHFSGSGVDATLQISALAERERRRISVEVSGHDAREHHEQSEVELRGAIASITGPSFVVGDRTVLTTTATAFRKGGTAISLADLHIGDLIEAEGTLQSDGTLLARSVHVEDGPQPGGDDGAGEDVTFEGALTAIAGSQLTVGATTVLVNTTTRIEKADQLIAASGLTIGDRLLVEGTLQADASVIAIEIHVLGAAAQNAATAAGSVVSIDVANSSFVVGTTTIRVDAHTSFAGHQSFAAFADLRVGDRVDVTAVRQGDGSLLASLVLRLDAPEAAEVELEGPIEQLSDASITVQGKRFLVDSSTVVRQSGNTIAFSSLKVGQTAEVRGLADSTGALHATRISVESGR